MAADRGEEIVSILNRLSERIHNIGDSVDKQSDLVLAAISALSDRATAVERSMAQIDNRLDKLDNRLDKLDNRLDKVEQAVGRVDRKVDGIARKLLAPAELVSLGIQDLRGAVGGGLSEPGLPRAAKPTE